MKTVTLEKKEKMLTINEASEISGISTRHLRRLSAKGQIPGVEGYAGIIWFIPEKWAIAHKNKKDEEKENFGNYISLQQAALISKISTTSLQAAVKRGAIKGIRRKKAMQEHWYIDITDPSFESYVLCAQIRAKRAQKH